MKVSLLLLLLSVATYAAAQFDDNPDNLKARVFELTVKTIPSKELKLPFQFIKIIDTRFDTSKLGFRFKHRHLSANTIFEKMILRPGNEKGVENFYNEYYKYNFTPNGKVLLISIKKLWINNVPDKQRENQRKDIKRLSLSQQDVYAKFEYYLGSENTYTPLKRIDTVFQLTPDTKVEDFDPKDENKLPFFCFALEKMIENVNYELYARDLERKKKMSEGDIEKYNATIKNIPILNEPIKRGVFVTFNEFIKNGPSVISFSKSKILKKKIYEIIDEKGNVILDYFAYNDGKKPAIAKHLADLFAANVSQDNFGIYRVNNSFQFFENYFQYSQINTSGTNGGFAYLFLLKCRAR